MGFCRKYQNLTKPYTKGQGLVFEPTLNVPVCAVFSRNCTDFELCLNSPVGCEWSAKIVLILWQSSGYRVPFLKVHPS